MQVNAHLVIVYSIKMGKFHCFIVYSNKIMDRFKSTFHIQSKFFRLVELIQIRNLFFYNPNFYIKSTRFRNYNINIILWTHIARLPAR